MKKFNMLFIIFVIVNSLATIGSVYANITITQNEIIAQKVYKDPMPSVSISGHVITGDTEEPAVGAEIQLAGIENYETVTDTIGMFIIPGVVSEQIYTLTIQYDGYQTYINDALEVGATDLDLGFLMISEIAYPPSNVSAVEIATGDAFISWNAPDGITRNNRSFESYMLHRLLTCDEDNPLTWVEIATNITDTTYTDATWQSVDPGVYKYAVTALYTNGVASEPAFSSNTCIDPPVPITVEISTNSGDNPEDALVILTNIDGNPEHVYQAIAPANGQITIPEVWPGIYDLSITLAGFDDFQQVGIDTYEVTTIIVVLQETIFAPSNLIVTDIDNGVLLAWDEAGPSTDLPIEQTNFDVYSRDGEATISENTRELMNYNIYVDGTIAGTTTELEYLLQGVAAGTHTFGVSALYTSGNESELVTVEMYTESEENLIPVVTKLSGNYPNPFNPTTTISFSLVEAGNVTIDIYNVRGEKVRTLVDGYMNADFYNINWNGTDDNQTSVASGVYFYKMKAGRYTSTKKMILMK